MSAFRTWNGVEQVMLCHVVYEPGTTVARHAHETAEQLMWIVDGDVTMAVGDETKRLGAGDVVVVNPGIEHELYSENGLTFIEALAPVLRDHVPNTERDLVLGAQGDSLHADH